VAQEIPSAPRPNREAETEDQGRAYRLSPRQVWDTTWGQSPLRYLALEPLCDPDLDDRLPGDTQALRLAIE